MAFIVFNQPYKGKLSRVVPADKAKKIQAMLDNPPDDITEEQGEFLLAIHKIYPGERVYKDPFEQLYHTGVTQGRTQGLPVHDR